MVAERIHGRGRKGVDRVGSNQLLDIKHVTVVFVLRARAGPKQPLYPRALGTQLLPSSAREKMLVALIGKLRTGDRGLAAEPGERTALVEIVYLLKTLLDEFVHRNVDAAHEKTGDARNLGGIAALRDEMLDPRQIGFDHLFIHTLREQQRDVDIDALTDELANRRQAVLCRRHLDHQIIA